MSKKYDALISVVVPIFNVPNDKLKRCIKSITDQTYKKLEIIIIDDGSYLEFKSEIDKLSSEDSRITVFHKVNEGVSSARNVGVEKAKGEYIAFIDADDYIGKNYIEILYGALEDNVDCVKCACLHGSENGSIRLKNKRRKKEIIVRREDALYFLYYAKQPLPGIEITAIWGCLLKTNICRKISFQNVKIAEDLIYFNEYIKLSKEIKYISNQLYVYCDSHAGAMHKKYTDESIENTVRTLEKQLKKTKQENKAYQSRIINAMMTVYMLLDDNSIKAKRIIEQNIRIYRAMILRDSHIKMKLRVGLMLSYFGMPYVKTIYRKLKNE